MAKMYLVKDLDGTVKVTRVYNHTLCVECRNHRDNDNSCLYEWSECLFGKPSFNKYMERRK